jgi:precorrin-2 dehydrogenase/sirohydrochlorin ferrochelatase
LPSAEYARDNLGMGYMVNLSLKGRAALVVGGGEIASRKVQDLLSAKAGVTVVAPRVCEGIVTLAQKGTIRAHFRPYRADDIGDAFVVIAATDDNDVNATVSRDATARNVLVNVVDVPALCTFIVPATVRRGDLTIAISTDGRCPSLSGILREELEGRYGPEYGKLVSLFSELRKRMMALAWKGPSIREKLAEIYRDGVIEPLASGDARKLEEFVASRL